jgi:hypothetical protein
MVSSDRGTGATRTEPAVEQQASPMPGETGWWWTVTPTTVHCPWCGRLIRDRPAVKRYRDSDAAALRWTGRPMEAPPEYVVWWESDDCCSAFPRSWFEAVAPETVEQWGARLGGWVQFQG